MTMTTAAHFEQLKQQNARLRILIRSTRKFVPLELQKAIDAELKDD